MKVNKYKSGGITGLAKMGVNKLLILGFGVKGKGVKSAYGLTDYLNQQLFS